MKLDLPPFLANINPLVAGGVLLLLGGGLALIRRPGSITAREQRVSRETGIPVAVLRSISRAEVGKGGQRSELTPEQARKGKGKGDDGLGRRTRELGLLGRRTRRHGLGPGRRTRALDM